MSSIPLLTKALFICYTLSRDIGDSMSTNYLSSLISITYEI